MVLTKLILNEITIEIRNDLVSITPAYGNYTSKLRRDNSCFKDWLNIYVDEPVLTDLHTFIQRR